MTAFITENYTAYIFYQITHFITLNKTIFNLVEWTFIMMKMSFKFI